MGAAARAGTRRLWLLLLALVCAAMVASMVQISGSNGIGAFTLQPAPTGAAAEEAELKPAAAHARQATAARQGPSSSGDSTLHASEYKRQQPSNASSSSSRKDGGGGSGRGKGDGSSGGKGDGSASSSSSSSASGKDGSSSESKSGADLRDLAATAAAAQLDGAALGAAAAAASAAELAAATLHAERATAAAAGAKVTSAGAVPAAPLPGLPVPKVALMFLTRGPLPLDRVWQEWIKDVDGVVPAYSLAALGCGDAAVQRVRKVGERQMGPKGLPLPLYLRQHLYSIYVHTPPDYTEKYARGSIFYGRKLRERVATQWGTHSLVVAVRLMLAEALRDPLNQRFLLLSEGDVPLWPAGLLYLQMMGEAKSRVGACAPLTAKEAQASNGAHNVSGLLGFPLSQWRKSSQWISLNRQHAQLVVDDTQIDARFAKDCYVKWDTKTWQRTPGDRWCVSDEHYIPVLLAAAGEEGNCSCSQPGGRASPTHTEWTGAPHPRTFTASDLVPAAVESVRACHVPTWQAALQWHRSLLPRAAYWTQRACSRAAADLATYGITLPGDGSSSVGTSAGNSSGDDGGDVAAEVGSGSADPPVGLLPQYQCKLTLRKVDSAAAGAVVRGLQQGLLESQPRKG